MAENIYIITGASRGIGAALYRQLHAREGNRVLGVARSNPEGFESFLTLDLTELSKHEAIISWLSERVSRAASVTLINNAGVVDPIGMVGALDTSSIQQAVTLNVTAPIALSNAFVNALKISNIPKKILNISSGASNSAIAGWATYCATKAALDQFTRVMHVEQQKAQFPVRVMAVAPGIIDTDMQKTIRASEDEEFPDVLRFRELKQTGQLQSPEDTARGLISLLQNPSFGAQAVGRL